MAIGLMGKVAIVAMVVAIVLGNEALASTPVTICNLTEEGMDACRPSVRSTDPVEPSGDCCQALSKADIPCLCSYRNSVLLPSLGIDPEVALQLPAKCSLPAPQC